MKFTASKSTLECIALAVGALSLFSFVGAQDVARCVPGWEWVWIQWSSSVFDGFETQSFGPDSHTTSWVRILARLQKVFCHRA